MLLLLHILQENIIRKLQKLYSPSKNHRVGNKSPALFVKNLFVQVIYCPRTKYSLKGLIVLTDQI